MKVEIYADGSGNTFDSDGGYGWRLVIDGVLYSEGSGYLASATNNVAEITAAIEGLKAVSAHISAAASQHTSVPQVVLVSDSQLVLGYANGSYQCKALHLTQLYIQLRQAYKSVGASTRWVKGHSGDEHNEAVDRLASSARKSKGIIKDENLYEVQYPKEES
jgi:ribonuclease HI